MGKQQRQFSHLCSELVTIHYTDNLGHRQRVTANLEEIAPQRLWLLVDARIPSGTAATIETQGLTFRGYAQNVEHNRTLGWFIEVRLAKDSHWSNKQYSPEHLLPPVPSLCRHRPATR